MLTGILYVGYPSLYLAVSLFFHLQFFIEAISSRYVLNSGHQFLHEFLNPPSQDCIKSLAQAVLDITIFQQ